jgi:hypothetical protein
VKGHPITIGQILADFVALCNGKIVEILTQILHFLKKTFQMGRRNELISPEPITIQR